MLLNTQIFSATLLKSHTKRHYQVIANINVIRMTFLFIVQARPVILGVLDIFRVQIDLRNIDIDSPRWKSVTWIMKNLNETFLKKVVFFALSSSITRHILIVMKKTSRIKKFRNCCWKITKKICRLLIILVYKMQTFFDTRKLVSIKF